MQRGSDAYLYTPRGLIEAMDTKRQDEFRKLAGSLDLREAPALLSELSDDILKTYRELKAADSNIRRTEGEIASMINGLLRRDGFLCI